MFDIILFEPEIPPNTGNIIRLCANTGAKLHLIKPLGFEFDDKKLKRAGLDYHEWASVKLFNSFNDCVQTIQPKRIFACETIGEKNYAENQYNAGDAFLFGPETRGLSQEILNSPYLSQVVRIPMLAKQRSLNLSNAVAIMLYEAWRQIGFS